MPDERSEDFKGNDRVELSEKFVEELEEILKILKKESFQEVRSS